MKAARPLLRLFVMRVHQYKGATELINVLKC